MIFQFFLSIIYSISSKSHVPRPSYHSRVAGCPGSSGSSFRSRLSTGSASHRVPWFGGAEELGRQATSLPVAAWTPGPVWNLGMMMVFFWTRGEKPDRINGIVIEFGGVRVESCNEHVYKWHILRQLREQVGVVWAFWGLKWSSHVSFCTLNCLLPSPSWATKQEDKRRTWTPISP